MSNFTNKVIVECKQTGKTLYVKEFASKEAAKENMKEIGYDDRDLYRKGINEVNTLFG